jgi:hypothetical protein
VEATFELRTDGQQYVLAAWTPNCTPIGSPSTGSRRPAG